MKPLVTPLRPNWRKLLDSYGYLVAALCLGVAGPVLAGVSLFAHHMWTKYTAETISATVVAVVLALALLWKREKNRHLTERAEELDGLNGALSQIATVAETNYQINGSQRVLLNYLTPQRSLRVEVTLQDSEEARRILRN